MHWINCKSKLFVVSKNKVACWLQRVTCNILCLVAGKLPDSENWMLSHDYSFFSTFFLHKLIGVSPDSVNNLYICIFPLITRSPFLKIVGKNLVLDRPIVPHEQQGCSNLHHATHKASQTCPQFKLNCHLFVLTKSDYPKQ